MKVGTAFNWEFLRRISSQTQIKGQVCFHLLQLKAELLNFPSVLVNEMTVMCLLPVFNSEHARVREVTISGIQFQIE